MNSAYHIEELRRGSEDAYRELFDTWYPSLCRTAERYLDDRSQAEAVAADALFCLWKVRRTLRDDIDLGAYLHQSIRNKCLNSLKSKYSRSEVPFSLLYEESNIAVCDPLTEDGREPLDGLLTKELEERIKLAVENLPEKTREVFQKNRFLGMSYAEIAKEMGISANTVKYHMKNALSLLRSELGAYLFTLLILILKFPG